MVDKIVRLHGTWKGIVARCNTPSANAYASYGGRGIKVCERWLDFLNFWEDMGVAPDGCSVDRIDNDGGYCPENCRWATRSQQSLNRRNTVYIAIDGVNKPLIEWGRELGIPYRTIKARWVRGMTPEQITTPERFPSGIEAARRVMLAGRRSATHCKHAHEFTQENTQINKNGTRHCIECGRRRARDFYRKKAGIL